MIIQANQTEMPQNRLNQYVLCLLMVFGIVLAVKCFSEVKKTKVFDLGLHGKILVTAKQIYIESFFQQWVLKTDPKWTIKNIAIESTNSPICSFSLTAVALPFEDDLRVVYDREDEVMIADGSGSEIVKIVLGFQQKEVTIEVFTSSQEKAVFRGVGGNQ